jgi:hypothetical protein
MLMTINNASENAKINSRKTGIVFSGVRICNVFAHQSTVYVQCTRHDAKFLYFCLVFQSVLWVSIHMDIDCDALDVVSYCFVKRWSIILWKQ